MDEVWFGTEASFQVVVKYLEQFDFNKEAFMRSPFDKADLGQQDTTYPVAADRIGLTVMEKVGDTTVIKVHGSLTPNFSRWQSWFPGEVTSYEALKDAFAIAMEAGETKVLMDINSGGGAVNGLDTVTQMITRAKKSGIKVSAHTDGRAMSAAYWLGSSATKFTAGRMAEVGSIGTMAVVSTYANTEQTMGKKFTVLKAGKYKAIGNPYEELTAEGKAYLQKNIDETNKFFLEHVSTARKLSLDDTDRWAEGQTFFAEKGVKVGLLDKVTTLDELIGSGSAAKNPSDNRRFEMIISAEKLAQIQAGAAPEDVLTEAELQAYNASLQEGDKPTAEELAAKEAADKDAAEKLAAEEAAKKPAEPAPVAADVGLTKLYADAMKANGKLEAQIEALTAQVGVLTESNTKLKADADALLVLGQTAVGNMQVALRKPKEAKGTVTEVLAQYNELQSTMAKVFKTGQQSKDQPVDDNTKSVVDAAYRFSVVDSKGAKKPTR